MVFLPAFLSVSLICALQPSHLNLRLVSAVTASPASPRSLVTLQHQQTGAPLGYDMLRSSAVHDAPAGEQAPPTCVLVHGILGSRRNLLSFGRRLADTFPSWQFLLVDLRCHGQSVQMGHAGPNTVETAAADVVALLNHLKIYPFMMIGHSFGGKVVMEMVLLSGRVLPRPVQVWVLDTVPGDAWREGGDHPKDTISFVRTLAMPLQSRKQLVDSLTGAGFTTEGAQWMATNLKARPDGQLDWTFDIEGIAEMYVSYEHTDLWPMLESQPQGLAVDFVRAEHSAFVWREEDIERIDATGANVHVLQDSSHWVHIDNPDGLLDLLAPSFSRVSPPARG